MDREAHDHRPIETENGSRPRREPKRAARQTTISDPGLGVGIRRPEIEGTGASRETGSGDDAEEAGHWAGGRGEVGENGRAGPPAQGVALWSHYRLTDLRAFAVVALGVERLVW